MRLERQEDHLAGGEAGGQDDHHRAAVLHEPALHHRRPSAIAACPDPTPASTPHSSASCRVAVMRDVSATPVAISASDATTVRRIVRSLLLGFW